MTQPTRMKPRKATAKKAPLKVVGAEPGTQLERALNFSAIELFSQEDGLDPLLDAIEAEVRSLVPDLSTVKGRKAIASTANNVARAKVKLDETGKELVRGWKTQAAKVDASRRAMRERLDALKAEIRAPLTEWEDADKAQKAAEALAITINFDHGNALVENELRDLKAKADKLQAEKDAADAEAERVEAERVEKQRASDEAERIRQVQEKQRELARQEAEEKVERDRIEAERVAKEKEEQALREKREAEEAAVQLARAQQDAADEASAQAERDKRKAVADAKREAEEKAQREADRVARDTRLLREREANAAIERQRAVNAARDEERRRSEAREAERVQAEQDDAARIAREQAERDEKARDKKHREDVQVQALHVLQSLTGRPKKQCAEVISLISSGQIPNVSIDYY